MAALAYVVPPLTGLVAYLFGSSVRQRLHGLQSVLFGVMWPAALYVASWLAPAVTRVVFGVGILAWLSLIALTAMGRDLVVPGLAEALKRAAEVAPRGRD